MDETGFGVKYETQLSAYTPPHWHRALELLLFVKGRVMCKMDGVTIQAKPGDLYLINSHQVHETRCSRDAVYLCIHISPEVMCRFLPTFDQLTFSLTYAPEDTQRDDAYRKLVGYARQILDATRSGRIASRLERQAHLFAMTALLVTWFSQPLAVEENRIRRSDRTRLEPLLDYIQLHHSQELPLEEAANMLRLNREYFCRLFKRNMGVSYLHYVYQIRTTAFFRELENSEDSIGELAQRHGFRDPKMLGHYFRELYGCTPSEKRRFFREVSGEE